MGNLYVDSSAIKFIFNTYSDLSVATDILLNIESPTGIKTQVEYEDLEVSGQNIEYIVTDEAQFTEPGVWKMYFTVIYADDRVTYSDTCKVPFNRKGV